MEIENEEKKEPEKEKEKEKGKGKEKKRKLTPRKDEKGKGKEEKGKKKTRRTPYTLGKVIGEKEYNNVQIGVHEETLERVCVIMVNLKGLPEDELAKRKREVGVLKLLHHPRIVNMHNAHFLKQRISVAIEFFPSGSLAKRLSQEGILDPKRAKHLFRQLVEAVHYLHSLSICHRDIRPENIFMTDSENIKLSDFANARVIHNDDEVFITQCTKPQYCAPEVLIDKKYKGRPVDVWSCGITLYYMLTHSFPFDDPDPEVVGELASKGDYEPEGECLGGMSLLLSDLLSKILIPNPNERLTIEQVAAHDWCVGDDEWKLHNPEIKLEGEPVKESDINADMKKNFGFLGADVQEVVKVLGTAEPTIYRPMYQIYSNLPSAPTKSSKNPNQNTSEGFSRMEGGKEKEGVGRARKHPPRLFGMDAGNRFKSTTDMLSATRYHRPIPVKNQTPSPSPVGLEASGKMRRSRVVSIYKTNSVHPEEELFASPDRKKRPVSIRERSTEIKDWLKEQNMGDEGNAQLEVASDGEERVSPRYPEEEGAPFPLQRSLTSTVFQARPDGAVHPVGLHSRPPVDLTVSPPAALFERSVEKDYIADESALCLFELDVQRDIIVSEGDEMVVVEGKEEEKGDDFINEDVDLRRSPTLEEMRRRSIGTASSPGPSSAGPTRSSSPRSSYSSRRVKDKGEKKTRRSPSPKQGE